jgi:hypothetical protein
MHLTNKTNAPSSKYGKVIPFGGHARKLETLYARRSAVETLIQSLEAYQRFRAQRMEPRESKTA